MCIGSRIDEIAGIQYVPFGQQICVAVNCCIALAIAGLNVNAHDIRLIGRNDVVAMRCRR